MRRPPGRIHSRARVGERPARPRTPARRYSSQTRPKPSQRGGVPPASAAGSPPRGGPRSGLLPPELVGFPVARVEEVVADRAEAHFRDERHHSLVVVLSHHLANSVDEGGVESGGDELGWTQPAVDHVIENEVGLGVAEPELAFVGLPFPELGGRGFAHDLFGHAEVQRELAQLRLVQVTDRVDPAGHVAELRAVAEEQLGLVARADDNPVGPRAIVFDALALAGHLVPHANPDPRVALVDRRGAEVRIYLRGDRHLLERETELLRNGARVQSRFLARMPVGGEETSTFSGPSASLASATDTALS